jgi:hypothetical protein
LFFRSLDALWGQYPIVNFGAKTHFLAMQNTLTFPSVDSSELEVNPSFNVVIAYEDFETGKHAKKTYDYLVEHLGHDCAFSNQMWKFDVLAVTKLREMAARDAVAADIIIVSAHGNSELPAEVKAWIELWLKPNGNAIALVALFDSLADGENNPVRSYLADVARRGKMEFFAQPGRWPRTSVTDGYERDMESTDKAYSVLAGAVQQGGSFPRWGINE